MRRAEIESWKRMKEETNDEKLKGIIDALLFRHTLRGRLYHLLETIRVFPAWVLLCMAESSPAIICFIAFWLAFICGKISNR